jgi:hypothetical protein
MPSLHALVRYLGEQNGNGEGGIRTLGTLLGYGALAKRCFRPLSHLTKSICDPPSLEGYGAAGEYGGELSIANCQLPIEMMNDDH